MLNILSSLSLLAAYDGRLADNPYHKSAIWIYILIIVGVLTLIGKWAKRGNGKRKSSTPTPPITSKINYKDTGLYWKICPTCKGRGYVDGKQSFKFPSTPDTISLGRVVCDKCKGFCHELNPEAISLYGELERQEQKESENCAQKRLNDPESAKIEALLSLWGATNDNTVLHSVSLRDRIKLLVENEPYCFNCMAKGYVEIWQDKNGNAYERVGCPNCHGQGKIFHD